MNDNDLFPYASAAVVLLQRIVYNEDKEWGELISYRRDIQKYFSGIGLDLFIDESEGYAFLRQREFSEEENAPPRLVRKNPLNYHATILCVLLREKILESESASSEGDRLVMSRTEIKEAAKIFFPHETNETKLLDKLDAAINKLTYEYHFLKEMNGNKERLEVKRIIRAVIDAEKLLEIKEKLLHYADSVDV